MNPEEREMLKSVLTGMSVRDAVVVANELINHRDSFKIVPIYKFKQETKHGIVRKFLKSEDTKFMQACSVANQVLGGTMEKPKVKPTRRQASKWLSGKGAAWKFGR
jgi:hypothetical protein